MTYTPTSLSSWQGMSQLAYASWIDGRLDIVWIVSPRSIFWGILNTRWCSRSNRSSKASRHGHFAQHLLSIISAFISPFLASSIHIFVPLCYKRGEVAQGIGCYFSFKIKLLEYSQSCKINVLSIRLYDGRFSVFKLHKPCILLYWALPVYWQYYSKFSKLRSWYSWSYLICKKELLLTMHHSEPWFWPCVMTECLYRLDVENRCLYFCIQ